MKLIKSTQEKMRDIERLTIRIVMESQNIILNGTEYKQSNIFQPVLFHVFVLAFFTDYPFCLYYHVLKLIKSTKLFDLNKVTPINCIQHWSSGCLTRYIQLYCVLKFLIKPVFSCQSQEEVSMYLSSSYQDISGYISTQ